MTYSSVSSDQVREEACDVSLTPEAVSSEHAESSQESKFLDHDALLDLPLDRGENEEKEYQVLDLIDLQTHVIEAYLTERFSPRLLPSPLNNPYVSRLRYAIYVSLQDLHQRCPSLEPRDRIEYLARNQAFHRSVYILQSYVMLRLEKLLLDPFCFQKNASYDHLAAEQTPVVTRETKYSTGNSLPNSSQTFVTKVSDEEEALSILERAFAQEVQHLWKSFSLLSPPPTNIFHLVHAQVSRNTQPCVSLKEFHLTSSSAETLPMLYRQSLMDDTPESSSASSSQNNTSDHYIPPGTVWTLDYTMLHHMVENGKVGLTG